MSDRRPLMPKATAVWLVENTALSFDQIAEFCGLHPLEVKGIADGEVAQGIKGMDPVTNGQLTREEIARAEKDSSHKLQLAESKVRAAAPAADAQGPALYAGFAPSRPAERRALAPAQPRGAEGQPDHAPRRHDEADDRPDPRPHALELGAADAAGSGDARALLADRPRRRSQESRAASRARPQRERQGSGKGRHAAARRRDDGTGSGKGRDPGAEGRRRSSRGNPRTGAGARPRQA